MVDFGQSMSALPRLQVRGSAGQDIQLRLAEVLNSDGPLYVENLRSAKATDHFILSGKGTEKFEPLFTFHGFRYAKITGLHARPDVETLKAVVLYTDAPFTVRFKTGDPMVKQLWSNVLWASDPASSERPQIARSAMSAWAGVPTRRSSRSADSIWGAKRNTADPGVDGCTIGWAP